MKATELNRLSIDELLSIRDSINEILWSKVDEERRNLETRIAAINRVDPLKNSFPGDSKKLNKIPPKYQNPENPSETWAGRGKIPRWLAAAIERGMKRDDFLIVSPPSRETAKVRQG